MSIILDENNRPLLEDKDIPLSRIFEALTRGKSLKDICSEFSLTNKELAEVFKYTARMMQGTMDGLCPRKSAELVVYIDGAARGNPGDAGIGVVFYDNKETLLKELKEYIGVTTNNVAEYKALIKALLTAAEEFGASKVRIFTDSELVARQMSGHYKVKNEELKELFARVKELAKRFKKLEINHIER